MYSVPYIISNDCDSSKPLDLPLSSPYIIALCYRIGNCEFITWSHIPVQHNPSPIKHSWFLLYLFSFIWLYLIIAVSLGLHMQPICSWKTELSKATCTSSQMSLNSRSWKQTLEATSRQETILWNSIVIWIVRVSFFL